MCVRVCVCVCVCSITDSVLNGVFCILHMIHSVHAMVVVVVVVVVILQLVGAQDMRVGSDVCVCPYMCTVITLFFLLLLLPFLFSP